jgi:HNH endonuclease/NUMOD4 motif
MANMAYSCARISWIKLFDNDMVEQMSTNWKAIEGYNRYRVNEYGEVMNVNTGRILKAGISSNGYYQVCLCKDGIMKGHTVHRLVAKAFIPETDYSLQINHIDGIKTNNHYSNLEWCTHKHNGEHAYKIGLTKCRKTINQLTIDGKFIKQWESILDVERELGINHPNISAVASGKRKSAGKFKWQYQST